MPLPTTTLSKENSEERTIFRRWRIERDPLIAAISDLYCTTPKELARYRVLREPTENEVRAVRAQIQRIQKYRPHARFLTERPFYSGTRLVGLTSAGVRLAEDRLGIKTARRFETRDADHEFLLTCFQNRYRELALRNGFEWEWERKVVDHRRLINEDALGTLVTPNGKFKHCIEIERQSFSQMDHLGKAKRYHAVFGKDESQKLFGVRRARVIFVTLTERRRQTMLEKFAEEYPYRMFWFTTVDLFMENFGGEIFKTPLEFAEAQKLRTEVENNPKMPREQKDETLLRARNLERTSYSFLSR